ncbi:hypothetical protein [Candidatus Uabimicrobium amorphum]|uniref:adenosine deaminase n=1 Tax=Uabimicrobium amorphum TaxID=2596890 RepID=A0A5S9IUL0_UABAM|nr:hypothetical protein [Candidatus Uabimicrobium amorphum]BBM86865.1 adenosine deaminase [Candidatus Uabimicrobium amorphum]
MESLFRAITLILLSIICFTSVQVYWEIELPQKNSFDSQKNFWDANMGSPAARFELAKRTEPELIAFVRRMPKGADLHNHASGASFCEYVLQAARDNQLKYNKDTQKFVAYLKIRYHNESKKFVSNQIEKYDSIASLEVENSHFLPTKNNAVSDSIIFSYHQQTKTFVSQTIQNPQNIHHITLKDQSNSYEFAVTQDIITIDHLQRDSSLLSSFLDRYSMRGWSEGKNNGHDHFFKIFEYLDSSQQSKKDVLVEMIPRNRYQNVQYLEVMMRSFPKKIEKGIAKKFAIDFDIHNLDKMFTHVQDIAKDYNMLEEIREYINRIDTDVQTYLRLRYPPSDNRGDIVIRYMHQLKRFKSPKDVFITAFIAAKASKLDKRVAGVNIVAPEDSPAAIVNFSHHMKILGYLWEKMEKPRFSLHAGELSLRESPVEPMRHHISESIHIGHALRIGHGVSIAWENNVVGLLQHMKERRILVEICLSSNESILGIKGDRHPFMMYKRAGIPMAISTDDEGISRSNLTMEFIKAIRRYDLNYYDVLTLVRNSLEYSFLEGESLFITGDYSKINPQFSDVRSKNWQANDQQQQIMEKNAKLRQQVKLERKIVAFEKFLLSGFK